VWRELYGAEPEAVPPYTADWAEPGGQEALLEAAIRWLAACEERPAQPGDVLLFRMRDGGIAKHLGIAGEVGEVASFIHAYSGHGVMESPLSLPWARRIVARFAYPAEGN
jgi:NlpC/P60 family putative phage cell wall peptidase